VSQGSMGQLDEADAALLRVEFVRLASRHLDAAYKLAGYMLGDAGGFAPNIGNEESLDYIMKAIEKAGYKPGDDIAIALDCASSELFDEGEKKGYKFWKSNPGKLFSADEMIELFTKWVNKYPIVSIEDPLDQDDWEGYVKMTKALGNRIQIVGDDFFVTNTKRLEKGIAMGACNSILIKVNQIGTVTETIEAIDMAKKANYTAVVSLLAGYRWIIAWSNEIFYPARFSRGLRCWYILAHRGRNVFLNRLLRLFGLRRRLNSLF